MNYSLPKYLQYEKLTKTILNEFNVSVENEGEKEMIIKYPYLDGTIKVNTPFLEEKWTTIHSESEPKRPRIFGGNQLPKRGDLLFLTGSEKDVMTLYAEGLKAICFYSEASDMEEFVLRNLSSRFNDILFLYQNNQEGIEVSKRYASKFNLPYVEWPNRIHLNDVTDFFYKGGSKSEIEELAEKAIQNRLKSNSELSFKNLMRLENKESDYIIKGILPACGISGLNGSSDTGKSLLLIQFALSYALNRPFLKQKVNGGRQVLYCSYEDEHISLKSRLKKLTKNLTETQIKILESKLHFQFYSDNNFQSIEKHLKTFPETGLIIIDPFSELMAGRDLNSSGEVREVMKSMHRLCLQGNLAIMYIHHNTKSSDKEGGMSKVNSSGSQAIEAKARVLFELKVENNIQRTLAIVKGNDIPISLKYPASKLILKFEDEESLWFQNSDSKVISRPVRTNKIIPDWKRVFDKDSELKYGEIKQRLLDIYGIPFSTAEKLIKSELSNFKSEKKGYYLSPFEKENFQQ